MNLHFRRAALAFLASSSFLAFFGWAAPAAQAGLDLKRTCRFVLHDETLELEDQALRVDLAQATFVAADEIFVLVEGLWKNDAVQRMVFLGFKHDRDIARLDLKRQQRRLESQASVVEQYRLQCDPTADEQATDRLRSVDEAFRKYVAADCAASELGVQIGKVDTDYQVEFLASVRDLRANEVATRQDVVLAQRDLEMARMRMQRATERVQACKSRSR